MLYRCIRALRLNSPQGLWQRQPGITLTLWQRGERECLLKNRPSSKFNIYTDNGHRHVLYSLEVLSEQTFCYFCLKATVELRVLHLF